MNYFCVNIKSYMCCRESCALFALSAALSKVLISSRCSISTLLPRCVLSLVVFLAFRSAPIFIHLDVSHGAGGDIRFDQDLRRH